VFINTTKTTLPVLKIAIAWNDEEGFTAINKIIKLCKWMRLNFTFEPIEIAGQNYQKNMIYGIDEDNLTRLKSADIFLHTKFDYTFFDKQKHTNAEDYIDIAMENYKRTYFFDENQQEKETIFFVKNRDYIANLQDFYSHNNREKKDLENNLEDSEENCDFYISIGNKYAVFGLNKLEEKQILRCFIELLNFVGLTDKVELLEPFNNQNNAIDEAIKFLQKNRTENISYVEKEKIKFLPAVQLVELETKKIDKITDKQTRFEGKFLVSKLVSAIKDREIKLAEDLLLYQIFANGVEVYPNINFWDMVVINPVIVCKTKDENDVKTIDLKSFFGE